MHILGDFLLVCIIFHFDLVLCTIMDIWQEIVFLRCKDQINQVWGKKEINLTTEQHQRSKRHSRQPLNLQCGLPSLHYEGEKLSNIVNPSFKLGNRQVCIRDHQVCGGFVHWFYLGPIRFYYVTQLYKGVFS